MDNISVAGSDNSPAIEFDFSEKSFRIAGVSYMEDVTSFYGVLLDQLEKYLSGLKGQEIRFAFDLSYFNSSSSRVIFNILEMLDKVAGSGNRVDIEWYFDDEDIGEEGEMIAEDLEHAAFKLIEK